MAWYHQATNHYLNQCWHRSLSLNGVTKPQWVKDFMVLKVVFVFVSNWILVHFDIWSLFTSPESGPCGVCGELPTCEHHLHEAVGLRHGLLVEWDHEGSLLGTWGEWGGREWKRKGEKGGGRKGWMREGGRVKRIGGREGVIEGGEEWRDWEKQRVR